MSKGQEGITHRFPRQRCPFLSFPRSSEPDHEGEKQFLDHPPGSYSKDRKTSQEPSVKDLHAKIGELSIENDFLSGALGRIGDDR